MPITYYPTFKNSSGNVGIGNINPGFRLDIKALTTNGSTVFVIRNANDANNTVFYDNGTVSAGSDFRAPIFYDSNDTAYYVNPNSVSNLSSLRIFSAFDTASSDVYANMRVMRNNATTDGMYIGYGNSGSTSALTRIFGGGATTGELSKYSNYTLEPGSFRSPIFYDSDNTGYYLDAASTSNLVGLTVANTITGSITGNAGGSSASCTGNAATATILQTARTIGGVSFNGSANIDLPGVNTAGNQNTSGNAATATNLSTNRTNWSTNGTITAVVGQLGWKHYNNNHTIFDASNSTSPAGGAISNSNPDVAWTGTYPTLMGWNGANTYGVRVDISRYSENVSYSPNRTDPTAYPVLWGVSSGSTTQAYSCASVYIQSSTGFLYANAFYDAGNTAFYCDPASTTNLNNLTVAGTMTFGTLAYTVGSRRSKNSSNVNIETVSGLISPSGPTFLEIRGFCPTTMYRTTGDRPAPYGLGFGNGSESGGIMPIGAGDNLQEIMLYGANSGPTTFTFKRQIWEGTAQDPDGSNYYGSSVFSINTGTGVVTASTDIRSPIYYDSDNTSYYINAAGTSVINALSLTTLNNMNAATGVWHTSAEGKGRFYFESNGTTYVKTANNFTFRNNSDSGVFTIDSSGNIRTTTAGDNFASYSLHVGGTGFASSDFRAPIFYDSGDTTYYIDPASFSLISSMGIGGLTSSNNVQMYDSYVDASSSYLQSPPLIIRKDNSATGAIDQAPVGLFIYNLNGTNNTWTKLSMGSREAAGAGNTVSIAGLAAQKTAGTANGWATGNLHFWTKAGATQITNMIAYSSGYIQSGYSFRAPIFYDSDNTSYYIDAASTSSLVGLTVANTITGAISGNAGTATTLQTARNINGTSFNGSAAITTATWGTARTLTIGSTGKSVDGSANVSWSLAELGAAATNQTMFIGTTSVAINRSSASQTLTGVSIDGNSATTTLATKATRANGNFYIDDNYGNTVVGLYSANRYQGVFAMGDSYKLAADGTGVGTLYGIAWSHPNAGGAAGNLSDHGALILLNGTYAAAISSSIRCTADMRTPIYYDSNDTAYYLNPNGGSSLVDVTANEFYARNWFRNNDSGEGIYNQTTTQHFYTDDVSYWNVASSSSVQGIRLRTGGYGGTIRGYFYADNANDVGLLNNAGNWRIRIVGGDYTLFDGSSIRAQIFFDTNDTAYYCDPAGTTNLSTLSIAGTLQFGGNINWNHGVTTELGRKTIGFNIWQGGKKLNADEDFNSGNNGISVYNNSGGSALTITRTALATAPNSSGQVLRVAYTPGSNGTSPGFGGFFFATQTAANKVFVTRFVANIPTGRSLAFHSNSFGTNTNSYWLTNNVGTGKWEEYVYVVMCGNTGTFSSTNFFAISGGSDVAFTWDIASATVFDITNKYESVSRVYTADLQMVAPIFYDQNNTSYYIDAASTSNLLGLTVANTITGNISGSSGSCTGNAATATILQTARNINGTSFNGSAAITTATWGTARTITIGSTGKSVDGSANVSWSLAELGAAATNQTMFIGTTSVAINRTSASQTLTGISIDGSAASATTATSLNSSNSIARVGSSGNYNTDFQNTPAGTVRHLGDDSTITNNPGGAWWFLDNYRHSNGSNFWGTQVAWGWEDNANRLATRNVTGGSFGSWVYYLNSGNYTSYTIARGGDTVTNTINFQSNLGTTSGSLAAPPLQAYATGTNAAFMSFHRAGNFAVNMGLDSDNVLRIGGWSASANRWQLDMSGNQYLAASCRATIFYDIDNTSYYIDAASASSLNTLTMAGIITTVSSGTAINFSGKSDSFGYNATSGLGTYIKGTGDTYIYGGGKFYDGLIEQTLLHTGNYFSYSSFNGAVSGTIFYDANDTGYYLDPNSTSNLLLVRTRNTFGQRVAVTAAASTTINTQYNVTELTLAATITTLTLSNIQASGIVHMWTIVTVGGGVGYSITWPAAVKWPGGTAPTLTTASSKRDIYQFVTYDGGTNIYAIIVGQNL